MSSKKSFIKTCEYCKNEFEAKTLYTRYCSHKCNSRHYKILKRLEKIKKVTEKQKISKKTSVKIPIETETEFMNNLTSKEFLSINDTANLIGVSKRTIYRLIKNKKLKVTKIGSRTIIKRCEIEKLFNQ